MSGVCPLIEGPAAGAIEFVEQQLKRLVGAFAGLLIVSLEEQVLAHFGYDARKVMALFGHYGDDPAAAQPLCERLQALLARSVTFAGAYYRHGDPEAFWIALRLA